ncbi:MAG: hypothetical protein R8K20_11270 [Gallionellaceae bacterium]
MNNSYPDTRISAFDKLRNERVLRHLSDAQINDAIERSCCSGRADAVFCAHQGVYYPNKCEAENDHNGFCGGCEHFRLEHRFNSDYAMEVALHLFGPCCVVCQEDVKYSEVHLRRSYVGNSDYGHINGPANDAQEYFHIFSNYRDIMCTRPLCEAHKARLNRLFKREIKGMKAKYFYYEEESLAFDRLLVEEVTALRKQRRRNEN